MTEKAERYKHAKVDEIIGGIRNKVLHAFNCGYEVGLKDGKAEPNEDAINRQAALDVIAETDITNGTEPVFTGKQVQALLRDLPPVTPKQRTGRWEIISGNNSRCSICGVYNPPDYFNRPVIYNYCPFCGAKMEG